MVFAFVLVDLKKQTEKEFVLEKLKRITEVKKTYLLYRNYVFLSSIFFAFRKRVMFKIFYLENHLLPKWVYT